MINLIKNELTKIFKKKSIYILLAIMLAFITLNTFLINKYGIETESDIQYSEENDIEFIKENLESYNKENIEEKKQYYYDLSEIEIYDLAKKYKETWKSALIKEKLSDVIHNMNNSKYIEKDEESYRKYKKEYDTFLNELDSHDWKYFANKEIKDFENQIANIESQKKDASKEEKEEYDGLIQILKNKIEKVKLRIEKNIPYSNTYLEDALRNYQVNFQTYDEYKKSVSENSEKTTSKNEYKIKGEYIAQATENAEAKYMIDNKTNLNNSKTVRNMLINTVSDNFLFIIIIIASIAGSIVSSEFDKGTIKLLLVRPYSRTKILLSKYIVTLFTILFSILAALIMQLIIGGIFFGFDSLSIPVVVYNFTADKVMYINLFKYIFDNILAILPEFILLATLGFAISVITNVSTLGVAIPIVGSGAADIINAFASLENIESFKYFVTLNWNFSSYLYGGVEPFCGVSIPFSIIICIVYFLLMIIPTFLIFKKRNIKNI